MRSMRRLTVLILAMVMVIPNTGNIMLGAATAKATTLRLEQTEGTATLKNANGIAKTIKAGMKLYNGDDVTTDKSSYAYISLDGTKAVKMDESSSVSIKQSGTQNEVMVNSGSLIFNVTVPLTKKESLNIRTSTMVTGVRGTIGYAKKISEEESEIAILEGKVELTSIDSKTGKSRSVFISAGEKGVCRRVKAKFEKNSDLQVPQAKAEKITEDDIPDFAVIEIGRNLDIQERLRKDGVFDVEKILARYRTLGDKGTFITIGTPVTPNSVSANKPVSPNTVSDNEAGSGGGGGGGAGGGGGGGSAPSPAAAPSITLATVNGGGVYAEGEPIGALSVTAEVDKAGAYTTYQWYVANSADGEGTAVSGATGTTYTPDPVLGTRYFYCVVRSKESSSSTAESRKETNRVVVAVKQPTTKVTEALSQPGDANIGFTSITLNPVSLASVGSIDGSINEAGSKIKLTGVSHSAPVSESLRAETVVFNAPVSSTSPVEGEVEYAKSLTATAPTDDDEWQTDRTFNGLAMGTAYYFFARAAATGSTFAGAPSRPIEIWTKAADAFDDYDYPADEKYPYLSFTVKWASEAVSPNAVVGGVDITKDVGSIEIPESIPLYDMDVKVTEIRGFSDHAGCPNLSFSKVVIPDTIEKIGYGAFYHRELTSVTIPDSVTEIGESAFNSCDQLETVVIGDGVDILSEGIFAGASSLKNLTLGKNIKVIEDNAFERCVGLESITISDKVESIGTMAFYKCSGLKSVHLGNGIKEIADSTFEDCTGLETVEFGDNITKLGYHAFYQCEKLDNVVLNEKVETIGEEAFKSCYGLQSINLNKGLVSIGKCSFASCSNLNEITIPSTVTYVSGNTGSVEDTLFYSWGTECGLTAIYLAKSSKPADWQDAWTTKSAGETIPVYYYEEDPDDPSVVRVYSPEATNMTDTTRATSLAFSGNVNNPNSSVYAKYINSTFLSKMLNSEKYNTVIIPDDNIAILNADLTIPEGKTLDIQGDMATENFTPQYDGYKKYTQTNIPRGTLTNLGTILVKGNLITSNEEMIIRDGNDVNFSEKWSSTIKSDGEIVVSGKMSIYYSHHNETSLQVLNTYYSGYNGLECRDLTITSSGNIDIYGMYSSGAAGHHQTNIAEGDISGMKADQFTTGDYTTTLSKTANAEQTGNFKLIFDIVSTDHYQLRILDIEENYSGIIYEEY